MRDDGRCDHGGSPEFCAVEIERKEKRDLAATNFELKKEVGKMKDLNTRYRNLLLQVLYNVESIPHSLEDDIRREVDPDGKV